MALVTLDEAKEYLRVDSDDELAMIQSLAEAAAALTKDVGRVSDETWAIINAPEENEPKEITQSRPILKVANLYALGYLFEHREEADHHDLTITMRNLLFSVREGII